MDKVLWLWVLAFGLASGGCSLLAEYRVIDEVALVNDRGHVVGHREVLRYNGSDERVLRVSLYTPRLSDEGTVIGYEERTRNGAIIRDLAGTPVGNRFKDLRSRGTNPDSTGVTVVFVAPPRERVSLAAVFEKKNDPPAAR
ncbi:hypothetical protein HY415_00730 [Candidatus Kaiserbacteria bacterium]|nr:hypothetical protein [Candidatus Kaiserbacteria bacterium]